jgi:hypothetical protein
MPTNIPIPAKPVAGSAHAFKYSLFYGYPGQRIVGYDNERGKGDHLHLNGIERPYKFQSVQQLVEDFIAAIDTWRNT